MFTAGGELEEKEVERTNVSISFAVGRMKRWSDSIELSKDGVKKKEGFGL